MTDEAPDGGDDRAGRVTPGSERDAHRYERYVRWSTYVTVVLVHAVTIALVTVAPGPLTAATVGLTVGHAACVMVVATWALDRIAGATGPPRGWPSLGVAWALLLASLVVVHLAGGHPERGGGRPRPARAWRAAAVRRRHAAAARRDAARRRPLGRPARGGRGRRSGRSG